MINFNKKFTTRDAKAAYDPTSLYRFLQDVIYYIKSIALLKYNFVFKEVTLDSDGIHEIRHGLGYKPKDVIITYLSGGNITFNYDQFTSDVIVVTTTGITSSLTVRFLYGLHED